MPKYDVYGKVAGTKFLGTFEAENEEKAIEKATENGVGICLCCECEDEFCNTPEIEEEFAELNED